MLRGVAQVWHTNDNKGRIMNWARRMALTGSLFAALVGGTVLLVPSAAMASPVVGGQFCSSKTEKWIVRQDAQGKWRQCQPDGQVWRWSKSEVPAPTTPVPTVSACVSAKPSVVPTPTPTTPLPSLPVVVPAALPLCSSKPASTSASPGPTAGGNSLPLTGAKTKVIAGIGASALVLGGLAIWIGRKRRTRFVA